MVIAVITENGARERRRMRSTSLPGRSPGFKVLRISPERGNMKTRAGVVNPSPILKLSANGSTVHLSNTIPFELPQSSAERASLEFFLGFS